MKINIDKVIIHGHEFAVFSIPVKSGEIVYMKQCLAPIASERFVIIVDRMIFESVWFKGGDKIVPELARGGLSTWQKDYKYSKADKGFSAGRSNPVPLAQMNANSRYPRVTFTDGITRTVWLLANGAKYFPVLSTNKKNSGKPSTLYRRERKRNSDHFRVNRVFSKTR